jgi:subtilisin family serine protease
MLAVTVSAPAFAQMTSPGKILIKLEKAAKTDAEAAARVEALACAKQHGLKLERRSALGWVVVSVAGNDEKATADALTCARDDKGVRAVDSITIQKAFRLPDDEFVDELWGFAAIGADFAWDTTIGLPTQRVGVVDTGISRDHIDLFEKDEAGFDFISDPAIAEDGDGRDAEYQDDAPGAGFHGSHVSGTIAASADDATGVPGLNWNAKIVTGRALGEVGGLSLDVVEAAAWMAGFDVPGVPSIGADRVSVINLSLGSDNPCSPLQEDFYGAIIESGVAVVAAAGNTDNFTPTGAPANCPGVIAVAAAGPTFRLASYSNFDDRIDVVAPGGDGFEFDPASSILSVDGSGDSSYIAIDGTSMACPHVTGVVSLMQAVNPNLSPAQIRAILQDSPFTCAAESCDNKSYLDAPDAIADALATEGELDDQPAPPPSGVGGGGQCPANSSPASGGGCACNSGFQPNAAETACVAVGGGGGVADDGCPPNSKPDGPNSCVCDPGFRVNEAEDGCEPRDDESGGENDDDEDDEDSDDEDSDDEEDARAAFSGCSSTKAPTSIAALAALLLIARRRCSKTIVMRRMAVVCAVVGVVSSVGCAHAVRIESTPGAEIFVNGKSVGTAPVTYNETTGSSESVQVTAKLNGREKTVIVQKSEVDFAPIGAGAGVGAATCGTGLAVTFVTALVFLPCAAVTGAASWGALAAAPAVSWFFFSHKMPDVVTVDLGGPPSAVAEVRASPLAERYARQW